jgi:hypothetical protein
MEPAHPGTPTNARAIHKHVMMFYLRIHTFACVSKRSIGREPPAVLESTAASLLPVNFNLHHLHYNVYICLSISINPAKRSRIDDAKIVRADHNE